MRPFDFTILIVPRSLMFPPCYNISYLQNARPSVASCVHQRKVPRALCVMDVPPANMGRQKMTEVAVKLVHSVGTIQAVMNLSASNVLLDSTREDPFALSANKANIQQQ